MVALQGDEEAAALRALAVLTELHRRNVWRDARTVNVIGASRLGGRSALRPPLPRGAAAPQGQPRTSLCTARRWARRLLCQLCLLGHRPPMRMYVSCAPRVGIQL